MIVVTKKLPYLTIHTYTADEKIIKKLSKIHSTKLYLFQNTTMQLLSPPLANNRRRSSVMFSGVVVLHGDENSPPQNPSCQSGFLSPPPPPNINTATSSEKNVCSSEKMTQTGIQLAIFLYLLILLVYNSTCSIYDVLCLFSKALKEGIHQPLAIYNKFKRCKNYCSYLNFQKED